MAKSLSLLLKRKRKLAEQMQQKKMTEGRIEHLLLTLERAKKQRRTQSAEIEKTQIIMGGHLKAAIKQACFRQETTLVQMILAVHPVALSKEAGLGRIMASFLSSDEIKALRNTCRAMTCFVHVRCKETAVPRNVYLGRDRDGWKKWGKRYELKFESRISTPSTSQ